MTAHRKITLWLGEEEPDPPAESSDYDIGSEDNMVAIGASLGNDEDVTVFICRSLFPEIRAVMDRIDGRFT